MLQYFITLKQELIYDEWGRNCSRFETPASRFQSLDVMTRTKKAISLTFLIIIPLAIYFFGETKVIVYIDGKPAAGEVFIVNGSHVEEETFNQDGSITVWSLNKTQREVFIKDMEGYSLGITFPKMGTIEYSINTQNNTCISTQRVNAFVEETTMYSIK